MARKYKRTFMERITEWVTYLLNTWGYYVVFIATFLETSAFVGLLVPGETTVVLAGFFASRGELDPGTAIYIQLLKVMGFAAAGAFLGDTTGYLIGRYGVTKLASKMGRFFFVREREMEKVRYYIDKHGGKTIFFGRFTSFLRAFAPFVAGMVRMPLRKFFFYDAMGAIPWAAAFSLLGYAFQESWKRAQETVGHAIIIALVLAVLIVIIYHKRRKKKV